MTGRRETWLDRYCREAPICPGRERHQYEDFGPPRESGYDAEETCKHCGTVRCSNVQKPPKTRWTVVGYLRRAKGENA